MVVRSRQDPLWPQRLRESLEQLGVASDPETRQRTMGAAWTLLNSVLLRDLRSEMRRLGSVSPEEILDIAADKSLELLRRAEAQQWKVDEKSPAEIAGFLRRVAQNGLIDCLRKSGREVVLGEGGVSLDSGAGPSSDAWGDSSRNIGPQERLECKEFATSLRDCVQTIQPRSRLIWFLRVFLSLSGNEIAGHPKVGLTRNHADMVLHRAREAIRECMEKRGHDGDVPRGGSLAILWKIFSSDLETLDGKHE